MKAIVFNAVVVSAVAMTACSAHKSSTASATAGASSVDEPADNAGSVNTAGANTVPTVSDITPASSADPSTVPVDVDAAAPSLATPVNVIITADNAYGFGYGNSVMMANYFGGVENNGSPEIFGCEAGPEKYLVPATDANVGNYIYIVSYADKNTTQGVLAQFYREGGLPVYTGAGSWQVCATGLDFDIGSGGPTLAQINEQLALCNGGTTDLVTTSGGWRTASDSPGGKLAVGEDNTTPRNAPTPGNEFQIACGIDAAARWMWYDWEVMRTSGSAFIWPGDSRTPGNPTKDFLIFRLGAQYVPPSHVN